MGEEGKRSLIDTYVNVMETGQNIGFNNDHLNTICNVNKRAPKLRTFELKIGKTFVVSFAFATVRSVFCLNACSVFNVSGELRRLIGR